MILSHHYKVEKSDSMVCSAIDESIEAEMECGKSGRHFCFLIGTNIQRSSSSKRLK